MEPYEHWPTEPDKRRKLALQVLATEIQSLHRGGTQWGAKLLSGHLPKRPSQAERDLAQWTQSLSSADKQYIEQIVASTVANVLFGFLVLLDGDKIGSAIAPNRVKYELGMLIYQPGAEQPERIPLNDPNGAWGLHEVLFEATEGNPITFPWESPSDGEKSDGSSRGE